MSKETNDYMSLTTEELIAELVARDKENQRLTLLAQGQAQQLSQLETSFALRIGNKIDNLTIARHSVRRFLQKRKHRSRQRELANIRKKREKERERARQAKMSQTRNAAKSGGSRNAPSGLEALKVKLRQFKVSLQRDRSVTLLPKKSYDLATADFATLKVATILDEFSYNCFKPEMDLYPVSIQNTLNDLETIQPDLLFVESAWKGSFGQWKIGLASNYVKMAELTNYCKEHDIPTIFWCKEDPVHFEHFLPLAEMFDYVFTTDENMVPEYKKACGHEDCYALPFAAQPVIHNPIATLEREPKVSFAGSYYRNKYHDRSMILCDMLSASQTFGVDIYDRNYESGIEHYRFPDEFEKDVKGVLPYDQIAKAYKGYKININVNTVTNSPTMFSRRVFESLACNTPLISNYAEGTELMFGDLINMSEEVDQYREHLRGLFENETAYQQLALTGLRRVLDEHTYRHRTATLLKPLNISVPLTKVSVVGVARAETVEEMCHVMNAFTAQKQVEAHYVLVVPQPLFAQVKTDELPEAVRVVSEDLFEVAPCLGDAAYVAVFHPAHYYGAYYLHDLLQTTKYGAFDAIAKSENIVVADQALRHTAQVTEYQTHATRMNVSRGILKCSWVTAEVLNEAFKDQASHLDVEPFYIDSFNFFAHGKEVSQDVLDATLSN